MFTVTINQAEKRYPSGPVFSGLSFLFQSGHRYSITGANGSGKSTLLKVLAGCSQLSSGEVFYTKNNKKIDEEGMAAHVSICAPWLDLPDELTGAELFRFHAAFNTMTVAGEDEFFETAMLSHARHKALKTYSTGMMQRMKLALAILTDKEVLLLDEPGSNLDLPGLELLQRLVENCSPQRLIIVSGNTAPEISLGNIGLNMVDFVKTRS